MLIADQNSKIQYTRLFDQKSMLLSETVRKYV